MVEPEGSAERSMSPGLARPVQPVMAVEVGMGLDKKSYALDGAPPSIEVLDDAQESDKTKLICAYCLMACFAFAGGFLTAKVGSGSDIMLFAYGHFVWNVLMPTRSFKDNQLTASSVITMGLLSLVTALCRALTRSISLRTFEVWGATSWLVCYGAPLGSLLLTPALVSYLRIAFYVLAIGQFLGFAILKIEDPPMGNQTFRRNAWTYFVIATCCIVLFAISHSLLVRKRLAGREDTLIPITCKTIMARLLPNHFKLE